MAEHDDGLSDSVRRILTAPRLSDFEGQEVIRCQIEVPGAAGGLRDALKFEPIEMRIGEEAVLVMKVRCKKVRHDEVKDTGALSRVHVLEPLDDLTAFVDESLVKEVLDGQAARVRLAREAAAGVQRLALVDDEEADLAEVLVAQHGQGVHGDGLRDGCPLCADEAAAVAEEEGGE